MTPIKKIVTLTLLVLLTAQSLVRMNAAVPAFAVMPRKVVLIDAGHGGWDPGMVGDETVLEKNTNMQIAGALQQMLEQSGAFVIMTRVRDEALGDRKRSDMLSRRELANTSKADMMVSIHQNAYQDADVSGAQVFYYSKSEESRRLAECIQSEIKSFVQLRNHREAKADSSYYILKETAIPAVIVECGFLSNPEERRNLTDPVYQEKIAWSIYLGILKYYGL